MVMEPESTVVSEFEGTLLKDADLFPYFMLVAFEGSGLLRFTILLILWPLFRLLDFVGKRDFSRRMMVFVSMIGLKEADIQTVARAVLPKFYMDGLDMEAWRLFESYERRVIVTRFPTLMVGSFVREHLKADDVIGCALEINRFGYATGFLCQEQEYCDSSSAEVEKVKRLFADGDRRPDVGMGRRSSAVISETSFLDFCLEQHHSPFATIGAQNQQLVRPLPVIFHDGRLVHLPTPWKALILILWIPIGIIAAAIRIVVGLLIPMRFIPYTLRILGGEITIKGNPPPPSVPGRSGVLFVCTHRTLMDPVILSMVLARQIPAVTYSLSRLSEILSPIPTIRLSRDRLIDSYRIKMELAKGDLAICPEGTTCREPFLLRFSSLFAELTDRIVPVAMNYRVGFFHPTTASGWKALDPIFFFMNPRPIYEVTFLDQLPIEATCSGNRSSHDVANNVQRILAATLGFECTSLTRKDKYKVLAGNDGIVGASSSIIQLLSSFIHNKKD